MSPKMSNMLLVPVSSYEDMYEIRKSYFDFKHHFLEMLIHDTQFKN